MDITLTQFVRALRSSGMPVSPAETMDGFRVLACLGISDRGLLRDGLRLAFAKSPGAKAQFDATFDRFYHHLGFQRDVKRSMIGQAPPDAVTALAAGAPEHVRQLIAALLAGHNELPALALQRAADQAGLRDLASLRDKPHFVRRIEELLGLPALDGIVADSAADSAAELVVLRYLRRYLHEEIKTYVDGEYALSVDATGRRELLDAALKSTLAQLPPGYFDAVDRVVERLAQDLARNHRRKERRARRGKLDLRRMLRDNVALDGALFKLRWKRHRRERGSVYVVCDVSNSVRSVARFLLMFLYHLADALPEMRTFVFSNRLGEVSGMFRRFEPAQAVEQALIEFGAGTTDYGRALVDLRNEIHEQLDNRATLIVLGDARTNYFDPKVEVLRELATRVRRLYWLNPETPDRWGEGDSEMARYAPQCFRVQTCNRLRDIERFADELLIATR